MDRQPRLGNVQATPQVTSPSHLRCTTKDFKEAAETLLFKEPYTIPERQKDTTAIRISSYFSSFTLLLFFLTTLSHPLPAPTHGHVFERRVLSKELLFKAVVRVRESLILSLTIKFFAVSFPLRRSPVLLFTEVLESFAGLRSQFNRPSSFVLTKKFPRSATRKLSLDDNLKFRAREKV